MSIDIYDQDEHGAAIEAHRIIDLIEQFAAERHFAWCHNDTVTVALLDDVIERLEKL